MAEEIYCDRQVCAKQVDVMYRELYEGQGKTNPSLMTRVYNIEEAIADMRKMKWALIIATIAAVSDIVSQHINFHFQEQEKDVR